MATRIRTRSTGGGAWRGLANVSEGVLSDISDRQKAKAKAEESAMRESGLSSRSQAHELGVSSRSQDTDVLKLYTEVMKNPSDYDPALVEALKRRAFGVAGVPIPAGQVGQALNPQEPKKPGIGETIGRWMQNLITPKQPDGARTNATTYDHDTVPSPNAGDFVEVDSPKQAEGLGLKKGAKFRIKGDPQLYEVY